MKRHLIAAALAALFPSLAIANNMINPPPDEPEEAHKSAPAKVQPQVLAPTRRIGLDGNAQKPATRTAKAPAPIMLPPLPDDEFAAAARSNLPLTPEQIRFLRRELDNVQRATAEQPGTPARPVSSSYTADLSPGSTPPVLRLSQNFVTSVVFVDATGAPWPFVSYALGGEESFDAKEPDTEGNALTIISKTAYGYGNLSVFLKGLSTPVTITLVSGQKEVDYRADIRVKARGPNASTPIGDADVSVSSDPLLLAALDGLMPSSARELTSADPDVRAWSAGGKMYLRTRMKLMAPAWIQSRMSPDGMNAYVLRETPVLTMTTGNREKLVKLSGFVWNDPSLGRKVKQVESGVAAAQPAQPQEIMPAAARPAVLQ
jgi:intracellular multiplication protein IcmK